MLQCGCSCKLRVLGQRLGLWVSLLYSPIGFGLIRARYRNFVMSCSALMGQQLQPLYFPLLDSPIAPGVRNLQQWIESAWANGDCASPIFSTLAEQAKVLTKMAKYS